MTAQKKIKLSEVYSDLSNIYRDLEFNRNSWQFQYNLALLQTIWNIKISACRAIESNDTDAYVQVFPVKEDVSIIVEGAASKGRMAAEETGETGLHAGWEACAGVIIDEVLAQFGGDKLLNQPDEISSLVYRIANIKLYVKSYKSVA